MANVGNLNVRIGADTSGLTSGINSAQKSLNTFSSVAANAVSVAIGTVMVKAFQSLSGAVTSSIKTFNDFNAAQIGLKSILDAQGKDFNSANKFIQDYISDGLVPLGDAVTAYKQLAQRGYSEEQAQKSLLALKDSSAFARQASLSMGEAIRGATEGLKNENSILVDNAGVTKNVSVMWKEYADSIGVGVNSLTKAQKIQAEVSGIMKETAFQTGDAAKYSATLGGQLASLSAQFTYLKAALGSALAPMISVVLPSFVSFIKTVTTALNTLAAFTKALFGANSAQAQNAKVAQAQASSAVSASDATTDLGKATKKAGADAKKGVAGFDEINQLQEDIAKNAADAADETSGVTTAITPTTDTSGVTKDAENMASKFKKAISDMQKSISDFYNSWGIKDIFTGIKEGINTFNFEGLKTSFANIGTQLSTILTSILPSVQTASANLGVLIGSTLSGAITASLTYFDAITAGISKFFTDNTKPIINFVNTIAGNLATAFQNLQLSISTYYMLLTQAFETNRTNIANSLANLLTTISNWLGTVGTIWSQSFVMFTGAILSFFETNKTNIQNALNNTISAVTNSLNLLSSIGNGILDSMKKYWDTWGKDIFAGILKVFTDIGAWILSFYNNVLVPIFNYALAWLKKIWTDNLQGIVDEVLKFIGKIGEALLLIYNSFIKPFIDYFIVELAPQIVSAVKLIIDIIGSTVNSIAGVVKNIMVILNGLIDIITGVFTGNWKKAWEGVREVFRGIMGGLWEIVKLPLNMIIGGINSMIRGLNTLKINIPKVNIPGMGEVGGGTIGFSIPEIPKLAKGGVTTSATLAQIGEAGKEAVLPLESTSVMDQLGGIIANSVMNAMQFATGATQSQTVQAILNIDGSAIARALIPLMNREEGRIGTTAILQTT